MSFPKPQPAELSHPTIGPIRCHRVGGLLQCLGVKYASLGHWFDNPRLCTYDGSGINAEQYGPQAISDPAAVDKEMEAIQKALPKPEFPGLSGTECLTLNITVPEDAHPSSALPVFVYIHGGGFQVGSNWWPQYDMKRIVRLSRNLGQPMIGINIKKVFIPSYRLGAAGFITSEELRQAGYKANRGLQDQRIALQWVKEYIGGFGGDPMRVTVCGESVGGLSATRLLYTEETLASRIVVLGGAPPSVSPLSLSAAESTYETVVAALGYQNLTPADRIKSLQRVPISDLQRNANPGLPLIPTLDGDLVPYVETFGLMESKDYVFKANPCEAAMVVFSPLDASIFAFMGLFSQRKGLAAAFEKFVHSSLHDDSAAARLLRCYNITPELSDEAALLRVLQFGSDIGHQAAARALAASLPGETLIMEFAEPNPWDGPFKGYSTHILDISFLLQNFNDYLDETQRAGAEQFAKDIVAFVYGQKLWHPFSTSEGIGRLEKGRRVYLDGAEAMTGRFQELLSIGKLVGLDALLGLWLGFTFST